MALLLKPGTRIAAEKSMQFLSCNIYVFNDSQSVQVDTIKTEKSGPNILMEPFLKLTLDEAQLLFDALYDAGYRRHDDVDTTGEIAAQIDHIKSLKNTCNFHADLIMKIIPEEAPDYA